VQTHPAAILSEVSLIANRAGALACACIRPNEGTTPALARPEEAVAEELGEVQGQPVLDCGPAAVIAAGDAAHDAPAGLSEIPCRSGSELKAPP
jgi:hypothetical protein